jgi:hypothetical protein
MHAPPTPGDRMAAFYDAVPIRRSEGHIEFVAEETARFAKELNIERYTEIMLCMWHRESAFQQHLNDGDSYGVTQVRKRYWKRLYKFWLDRGHVLGDISDPSTQAAFGVAMFHEHLKLADGNPWEAVRRYNGSGPKAMRYLKRVRASYKRIYGRP